MAVNLKKIRKPSLVIVGGIFGSSFLYLGSVDAVPFADAGNDRAVDQAVEITLDGTRSRNTSGYPLGYRWRQTQGPSVTIFNSESSQPRFTSPAVGAETDLWFQLIVTDERNATSSDDVRIIVRRAVPGNLPPTVLPNPPQSVFENTLVTLIGTATDPEGGPVTIERCQCDPHGPRVTLSSLVTATATFTAPSVQEDVTLRFNVFARDQHGVPEIGVEEVRIMNVPPRANAGSDQRVNEGDVVFLDGSASNPDGEPVTYAWTQTAGPGVTLNSNSIARPKFVAPIVTANVDLAFRLTVRDSQGRNTQDDVTITVLEAGRNAPVNSRVSEFIVRPNPSNPSGEGTFFQFRLDAPSRVVIVVDDPFGNQVDEMEVAGTAGLNVVPWDGANGNGPIGPGGYLVEITATDPDGKESKATDKMGIVR